MGRKKSSAADGFVDAVARLPWWVGVIVAMLSYLVLHQIAKPGPPVAVQPGQVGAFVSRSMIPALAYPAQFIVPILCLIGAAVSFFGRKKRTSLLSAVTQSNSAEALNAMAWQEFELLVGEAFRARGYRVTEMGGPREDGGVDMVLHKDSETWLVQCKQWKAYKVDVAVVRELYGVMAGRGASGGYVITSGTFTGPALEFAKGRNVRLMDGPQLFELIQDARAASPARGTLRAVPGLAPLQAAPSCPACAATMVRRTAQKGPNAGSQFWGCSRFPACRGTR